MVTERILMAWDAQPVIVTKSRSAKIKRPAGAVPRFAPSIGPQKPYVPRPELSYEVHTSAYTPIDETRGDPLRDVKVHKGPGRPRKTQLTQEEARERESLVEMARQGLTYEDIAERVGLTVPQTRQLVYRYMIHKQIGIKRKEQYHRRHLSPDEVLRTLDLWNSGKTIREISRVIGVSEDAIRRRLYQFEYRGYKMRPLIPTSPRKGISKYE